MGNMMEQRIEKRLGKISSASFGKGGYDGVMVGLSLEFSLDGGASGVGNFEGFWAMEPDTRAKWTSDDQIRKLGEVVMLLSRLLTQTGGRDVHDLVGIPVEVTLVNSTLQIWRILSEVL